MQPGEHGHLRVDARPPKLSLSVHGSGHQPRVPHCGVAMHRAQPDKDIDKNRGQEACHTMDLGLDGFRECPQVGPNACRYALPFGYAFLCCHPDLQDRQPAVPAGAIPK